MARTIKCKNCKTVNNKYSQVCKSCGVELYPEISKKTAVVITIILDSIFTFIYLFGLYLFIVNSNNNETPKYINLLPAPNTLFYFLIIFLFILLSVSNIFYILNVLKNKKNIITYIRRLSMFIEGIIMLPIQTLLALYFYEPATNLDEKDKNK